MPQFGDKSKTMMSSIHPKLQRILCVAIKIIDFSIIEGHRTEERQKQLVAEGKSKTMNSKHLPYPSEAVDIAPCPYPDMNNPRDVQQIYFLIGIIVGIANMLDIKIRVGADFNGDNDIRNETFLDAFHLEILEQK